MNTLKGNYTGKVGQTVGSKWKNLSTERVFTKPSNPNTEAQLTCSESGLQREQQKR